MSDMPEEGLLEVACDESGSEGENVAQAQHRVFCHGSVALGEDEAQSLVEELRTRTGSRRTELKAEAVIGSPETLEWLFDRSGPLEDRAQVFLVDKQYFLVAKVVDLLIEELTHARGQDLYADGLARKLARGLFRNGHRDLGDVMWAQLLASFNSLMRVKQRSGMKATIDDFFNVVERARKAAHRREVWNALDLVRQTREHAEAFQKAIATNPDRTRSLDPLSAALPSTIRGWAAISSDEIRIIHDNQAALTAEVVDEIIQGLRHPYYEFARFAPPVRIRDIVQVDSKLDPRVQVADVVAGVGRWAATGVLETTMGEAKIGLGHFLSSESLWADQDSFTSLGGHVFP
jgi:hypothetical protein